MKKLFVFTISIFFALNFYGQIDLKLYEESSDYYEAGKYKKALNLINKAISHNDKKSDYYILKGEILYEINQDLEEFFGLLSKATMVEPNSPIPLVTRAYYYEQINKYQDAILDYNDALKLAKEDSIILGIYTNRGGLYTKIQKLDLAYEDLQKAKSIDSNNIGMLNNLALCLDDLGKKEEAYKTLLRMIEIDSLFYPAWINLGFQASLREKYDDALMYLNKADKLKPDEAYTLNNRGYVKFKLNDLDGALKDINRSIELMPSNSYAYRNKALVYLQIGDNQKVCDNLNLAKDYNFSVYYGDEVDELIKTNCLK